MSQAASGQAASGQAASGQAASGQAGSGQAASGHPFDLVDELLSDRENEKGSMPNYHSFKTPIPTESKISPEEVISDLYNPTGRRSTRISSSIIELCGQTPLIRLDKLREKYGLKCNLLAKAEYMSVGGSIKDRIAMAMILQAEENKQIKPGDVIVEATSGNTGIGLALISALKGYHCIIVMPKKMSAEKANVLTRLGAKLIRTRSSAQTFDNDSHLSITYWLVDELNKRSQGKFQAICLDQYKHPGNIAAHFYGTAAEILAQTGGKIDAFVAGAGTGGTVSGVGARLRQEIPTCRIIGVDPIGSILHDKTINNDETKEKIIVDKSGYEVEGIGYDFYPSTLRHDVVDEWVIVDDRQGLMMVRDAISTEGVLCGGSSGFALYGAIEIGRKMKEGQNVVVILPDSIRNYLNKFASDDWMLTHCIFNNEFEHSDFLAIKKNSININQNLPLIKINTINSSISIKEAFETLNSTSTDWTAVTKKDPITLQEKLLGIVSRKHLALEILKCNLDQPTKENRNQPIITLDSIISPHTMLPISKSTLNQIHQPHSGRKICLDLLALNRDVTLPPGGGVLMVTDIERTSHETLKDYRKRVITNYNLSNDIAIITLEDFAQSSLS